MGLNPHPLDDKRLKLELDRELADVSPDDLERLAAARPAAPAADERGRVPGRIVEIRGADVYVDLGGKSEAFLPLDEFDPHTPPQPGELHTFVMQGIDRESGLMRLSLREARTEADLDSIRVGDVVEGRVTGLNLGGLELTVGSLRGFLPKSQVELERIEDFTPYIGRRLECQITEIDRRGRNLVLSRRRVLERKREELRQQVRYTLAEGQVRKGVVRRLMEYGAFVDLGGVDGLLHVSDISYARVSHPRDVLKVGDEIEVKVLKIDLVKDRISLGTKQLQPDPWNVVEANYRLGQNVEGRVLRLMPFGAFVELEPGVEGLLPVSELSWTKRVNHPRELLQEGDAIRCSILAVDVEQRKIALSLKALGPDPWRDVHERYLPDTVVSGRVRGLADFGAFIELEEGVEGLVHISEMSDKRIRTPADVCKAGDVVQVRVKSVDPAQRRISLSMRIAPAEEADEASAEAATAAGSATSGGATKPARPAAKPRKRKALKGGLDR